MIKNDIPQLLFCADLPFILWESYGILCGCVLTVNR